MGMHRRHTHRKLEHLPSSHRVVARAWNMVVLTELVLTDGTTIKTRGNPTGFMNAICNNCFSSLHMWLHTMPAKTPAKLFGHFHTEACRDDMRNLGRSRLPLLHSVHRILHPMHVACQNQRCSLKIPSFMYIDFFLRSVCKLVLFLLSMLTHPGYWAVRSQTNRSTYGWQTPV